MKQGRVTSALARSENKKTDENLETARARGHPQDTLSESTHTNKLPCPGPDSPWSMFFLGCAWHGCSDVCTSTLPTQCAKHCFDVWTLWIKVWSILLDVWVQRNLHLGTATDCECECEASGDRGGGIRAMSKDMSPVWVRPKFHHHQNLLVRCHRGVSFAFSHSFGRGYENTVETSAVEPKIILSPHPSLTPTLTFTTKVSDGPHNVISWASFYFCCSLRYLNLSLLCHIWPHSIYQVRLPVPSSMFRPLFQRVLSVETTPNPRELPLVCSGSLFQHNSE